MKLIKPFKILLQPCIFCSLVGNGIVCNPNPLRHEFSGWLLSRPIYQPISFKHLILPLLPHPILDGFVNSYIDRLTQICAASGNMYDLNPKGLNAVDYCSHHVDAICVQDQQGNNTLFPDVFPWNKNEVDPYVHHFFIHPSLFLTGVEAVGRKCLQFLARDTAISFALEYEEGLEQLAAA